MTFCQLAGFQKMKHLIRQVKQPEQVGDRDPTPADAAREGWSVRETEDRARGGGEVKRARRRRPRGIEHPDEVAAAAQAADALGALLGAEVKVTRRGGGYRAEIAFDSLDDALALAERLSRRPAA